MRLQPIALVTTLLLAACSSSNEPAAPNDSGTTADSSTDGESEMTVPDAGDALATKRAACTFTKGAKVADTLGFTVGDRTKLPIGHIIVVMKENRSYDHYFGQLAKERSDVEAIPAGFTNPDATGAMVAPTHETNACFPFDPEHQWDNMHAMYDDGKMDGFIKNAVDHSVDKDDATKVTTDGHFVFTYRERADLPFYYWLTDNYAMADQWHCATIAGTWANRLYVYAGQSYGVKNTGGEVPPDGINTIFDELKAAGVTYAMYSDDFYPLDGSMLGLGYSSGNPNFFNEKAFFDALAAGTLPQVVFLDATTNKSSAPFGGLDEHPPGDVQAGEQWTKKVYDAVTASPLWFKDGKGIAMIWTYDETGGFLDHVPPPKGCVADPTYPEFDRLGFRVPFVMISPFAKKKFVTHKVYDHGAIARFIEMTHDLPAMSNRDANAESILEFFDFDGIPNKTPGTAPAAGSGGCK